MNDITCPFCHKQFELADTPEFKNQLSKATSEIEEKQKEKLEKVRVDAEKLAYKKFEEEKSKELEKTNKEKELLEKKLEEQKKEQEKISEKIKEETEKAAADKFHNEKLQYEKKIKDMQVAAENVQRKGKQGSQQLQGDVVEIELEEQLKAAFPNDKISPVVTGKVGADIVQEVWDSRGNYNGKILWELKNTQPPWKEDWLNKLNSDKRNINANDAVLISEVLPKDVKNSVSFQKGIWIAKKPMALVIAMGIRAKIIHGYYIQKSSEGKNEKIERLYKYLSGTEFQHRMEAIIESYTNMQVSIEKERNYFARKWAKEEKNLRQLIDSTYGMRGDLEGIGAEMLDLKEPVALDSGGTDEQETLV
jgi:hypothetical protein